MSWPTVTADDNGEYFRVFRDALWWIVSPNPAADEEPEWLAILEGDPEIQGVGDNFWTAISNAWKEKK